MNRQLPFVAALAFLLLSVTRSLCQEYPMLHFTVEDGLPSNNIYEVFKDSRGYLWFCTDKGIAVYNGLRFEKFTTFNGLPDNEIFFIKEDVFGRLWMSTYNGALCYYKDDSFHTAANTPFLKLNFKTSHIESIVLEKDSSITFNYYDKSTLLNIKNNKANIYHLDRSPSKDLMHATVYKRKYTANTYELITMSGNVVIDTMGRIMSVLSVQSPDSTIGYRLSQNKDYLFNKDSVYDVGGRMVHPLGAKFSRIFKHLFYWDDRNNFFLLTNEGLFINDTMELLKGMDVTSIAQGNKGNYWITTKNKGAYCLRKNFENTRVFKDVYKGEVKFCYTDGKYLFYTTSDDDLFRFDKGKIRCVFDYQKHKKDVHKYSNEASYLIDEKYRYYYFYNNDNIILDNVLSGDPVIKSNDDHDLSAGIKGIIPVADYIYIKQRTRVIGIDLTDLLAGKKHGYKIISDPAQTERIFGMAKANDNSIWYSTVKNVYKTEKGKGIVQPQFKDISFKYFGFYGKYLIGYTPEYRLLICSNFDGDKIVTDTISGQSCIWDKFYQLDATHLLLSTDNLYRLMSLDSINSNKRSPVSAIENLFVPLQADAVCADRTNCYFFKDGSITSIDVKSLFVRSPPPELSFTFLKTGKISHPIQNEINLPFSESRHLTVSFSTLSYGGKEVSYEYSFSRNDRDNWNVINGTDINDINLVNSGYGSYIIKVRAKTISSEYSAPIVFTLNISKPYWATWWFMALCILGGAIIVLLIIRYRIFNAVRKKEKAHNTEVKFMRSEYKALNALMNPHFIFNTINNVQGLVNRNDKLAANEYLRVFADLIRQNMHNISKELIPLQKEMDLVTNYLLLEKLRFKEFLNYSIDIDEELDLSEIMVPPLLVQPLVENSIKHGILPLESGEGFIRINIYESNDYLYIEVKDNGVGMGQSMKEGDPEHVSFGLDNIKKRIEQLSIIQNKQITFKVSEIKDEQDGQLWTVITISMSLSQ